MPDQRLLGTTGITTIAELIRLANRYGLTWERRPGTVVSVTSPFTDRHVAVRLDGDEFDVSVKSLTGPLMVGDRVMVDQVPRSGLYAVGLLNRDGPIPDPADVPMAVSSTSNSATVIAEAVVLTITGATLVAGSTYTVGAGSAVAGVNVTPASYRLRKGSTVGGTLWAQGPEFSALSGVIGASAQWRTYITPTVTMTTNVSLTVTSTLLGVVHVGTALIPRYLTLNRVSADTVGYPMAVPVT